MSEQAVVALSGPSSKRVEYLEHLMCRVPGMMANMVAASTAKGYDGHGRRWVKFVEEHGVAHLPVDKSHLCAYFIHL